MRSFRSELEDLNNPVVEQDIIELGNKIALFKEGRLDEEKFRSLRLARGVYGQRQQGVQMIRIKLPYGRLTSEQLLRIAAVSDRWSNGKLHFTTRQDIQIHYVRLDDTPEVWAELEKDEITLREACGNTVRNITASPLAGVDVDEPFDVSPYADALFSYFLRNPVNEDMGRKIKIAFSSSTRDTAFTYIHDLGFIPLVQNGQRGFKVLLGGGLGSQPRLANQAVDFLPEDELIPFTEAVLRVFDRYGERARRNKARLKFLIKSLGIEAFLELVEAERSRLGLLSIAVNDAAGQPLLTSLKRKPVIPHDESAFALWKRSNAYLQKQQGFYAVAIRIPRGNISTNTARKLSSVIRTYAANETRVTIDQGLLLRYVSAADLPALFNALTHIGLALPGAAGTADITSCPGTDTCNLGISNSTGVAKALEGVIAGNYPHLIANLDLRVRISGCMNSCGQHTLSAIGFHGSSVKVGDKIAPALQVLLGGGNLESGDGIFAEKVIKVPSKRAIETLQTILDDFEDNHREGEYYHSYFQRQGKDYFYQLLKPLADTSTLTESDFLDWGSEQAFKPEIGVGECAGVTLDLVGTLLFDAGEKAERARQALANEQYGDSIYLSYAALISGAKAKLVGAQVRTNTHQGIITDFAERFGDTIEGSATGFTRLIELSREAEPSAHFAEWYADESNNFVSQLKQERLTVAPFDSLPAGQAGAQGAAGVN